MNYIDVLERKLLNVDSKICNLIDDYKILKNEDRLADYTIQFLRTYVEHVAARLYADEHPDEEVIIKGHDRTMTKYNGVFGNRNEYRFLKELLASLQITVSHFVPEGDGAKRYMMMYLPWLYQLKELMKRKFDLDLLHNIDDYPCEHGDLQDGYYKSIAEKVCTVDAEDIIKQDRARYYIVKKRYRHLNGRNLFEYVLSYARDKQSKFERFVAFSDNDIPENYAISCEFAQSAVHYEGIEINIKIIVTWVVSIRPCELKKLASMCGVDLTIRSKYKVYNELMAFLTKTGLNLLDIIVSNDHTYTSYLSRSGIQKSRYLKNVCDKCRQIIRDEKDGKNIIRYLFCFLRNDIIGDQLSERENDRLSYLNLKNEAIPFDQHPFASSLFNHNISNRDLVRCISGEGCECQFVVDMINKAATEDNILYYAPEKDKYEYFKLMIEEFNSSLYSSEKQQARRIEIFADKYFYEKNNYEETARIIRRIQEYQQGGVAGYSRMATAFFDSFDEIDDETKKKVVADAFVHSKVALLYGAAGTGKTKVIEYVSRLFFAKKVVYLGNTNATIENIKRRVPEAEECYTVYDYIKNRHGQTYDLAVIDECSNICNSDMLRLLGTLQADALLLVGDVYQIEPIKFGNWFSFSRYFIESKAVHELKTPHRAKNEETLLKAWQYVREHDINMFERLFDLGVITPLDHTIFELGEEEIILCLGYDGLFGVNNVNRCLQNANPNTPVTWENWVYKVGDPILFSDDRRFGKILYNNLNGRIRSIKKCKNEIVFDILIDKQISDDEAFYAGVQLLPSDIKGKSCVRIDVKKRKERDNEDNDKELFETVPFQVAYSVSIHKAQGLEYDSVKVVITEDIEDKITHSIFYTAITRARKKLKIYMSDITQAKLAKRFEEGDVCLYQARIFEGHSGLKMSKKHSA